MTRCLGALVFFTVATAMSVGAEATQDQAIAFLKAIKAKYKENPKGSNTIVRVETGRKKIGDDNMKYIGALTKLQDLNIGGPVAKQVGDKNIYGPGQITDKGLEKIADLTELRELTLDGANITDDGLKHLAKMSKLQTLILSSTKVTDDGMQHLTKLPKLENVYLFDTKVTDSGVGVLKRWKIEIKVSR